MDTFLATLVLFGVVIASMAVGVALSGRSLRGSCGGLGGKACPCTPDEREACRARAGTPEA